MYSKIMNATPSQKDDMAMYLLGGGILLVLLLAFSYSNSYSSSNNCSSHSVEQTERNDFKSLTETLFTAPIPVVPMPFVVQPTELVVPSVGGIVLQGGTNNYIRVAGTATTDATRNAVGTSNNQVQIYNAGNLTAAFDVDGLYVRALNAGSGNITTTGSIGISGTPVGAVYCGSITSTTITVGQSGASGTNGVSLFYGTRLNLGSSDNSNAWYLANVNNNLSFTTTGNGTIQMNNSLSVTGSVTSNSVVVGSGGIHIAHGSNNYIYTTTYDGYTPGSLNNNLIIKSWHGIGFATYDNTVRVTIDTRTGDAHFSGTVNTGGEVYAGNWFRVKNQACGLWWETPGAGITSAVGGGNAYGTICTSGTGRNGWSGYGIGTRHCFMGNGTECGIYDNNGEWYINFNNERRCYIPNSLIVNGGVNINGTNSSGWALDVANVGYGSMVLGGTAYLLTNTDTGSHAGLGGFTMGNVTGLSARFQGGLVATGITKYSDCRIKKDVIQINNDTSLQQIRLLEPVSYHYVDPIRNGTKRDYGFIAQNVQKIIPDSIMYEQNYIPNIFDNATIINKNIIQLANKNCFTIDMNKIQIICGEDDKRLELSITVLSSNSCKLDSEINYSTCFVYGSYVNDMHILKQEMIFTIGISAIKELDKKIVSLEDENLVLKEQINTQQSQLDKLIAWANTKGYNGL
jgi:hypothetical protein